MPNTKKTLGRAARDPVTLLQGDALSRLRTLPSDFAHSLVTDPPAGIGLYDLAWDGDRGGADAWIVWLAEIMAEALRVLRPGAHGLVWAYPRTSHWTARALERAGFEVRDVFTHAFAYRMPKGIDMGRAVDKRVGAKGRKVGSRKASDFSTGHLNARRAGRRIIDVVAPSSTLGRAWAGWQTTIRGATEHWILVRKPPRCTSVDTVLEHGTCALNVGACSVPGRTASTFVTSHTERCSSSRCEAGCPSTVLERAAKYFYAHRPSRTEREAGCERLARRHFDGTVDVHGSQNFHACAKPISLMRWLVRLVTAPGGVVLDPFAGSGSTGCAAVLEGARFVGIERDALALSVARARIRHWQRRSP